MKWLEKYWLLALQIIIAIILPLIWLDSNFLYASEETNFANYQNVVEKNLYSWSEGISYGEPAQHGNHSSLIPNGLFYYIFSYFGLSNSIIQKVFLSIVIFLILFNISSLIRIFTENKLVILTGSLFYLLNFYSQNAIFYSVKMYQLILMPLLFVWFYRYLKENKNIYLFYNFIILFLFQTIFANPPLLATTLLVYPLAAIYFIIETKIGIVQFVKLYFKKTIYFLLILFPLFLYHYLIYKFTFFQNSEDLKNQTTLFLNYQGKIGEMIQLRGSFWENKDFEGIYYNHWGDFYKSSIIVIISYLLLLPVVIYGYTKKLFKDKIFLLWLIAAIIFLLFTSGFVFYPKIYLWLYNNIPYFFIFRDPWAKFMPLFLFSLTITVSIALSKLKIKYLTILILLLIIIRGTPFFSNNFFDHSSIGWKKILITLPSYWQEYIEWTKNNRETYVLPLPFLGDSTDIFISKWYTQNLGNSPFPNYLLFGTNNSLTAKTHLAPLSNFTKLANEFFIDNNMDFIKIAPVDYLLEQKDLDLQYKRTKEIYDNQKEVKKYFADLPLQNFSDKLLLYKIKEEYVLPKFYSADKIITYSQPIETIPAIVSSDDFDKYTVLMSEQAIENSKLNISEFAENVYSFKKDDSIDNEKKYQDINLSLENIAVAISKGNNLKDQNSPLYVPESMKNTLLEQKRLQNLLEDEEAAKKYVLIKEKISENNNEFSSPKIVYKKINPASYRIKISAKNPFTLIFNEDYNDKWIAYLKNSKLDEKSHFMANGYANLWLVNPEKICQSKNTNCIKDENGIYNFELTIKYSPQKTFNLIFAINVILLIVSIIISGCYFVPTLSREKFPAG